MGTGGSIPAVVGPDSATTAWVAAVVTNGGTVSSPRQTIVDTLIKGLKADAVWGDLDRLWLHAAENEPSALTDLVSLSLATAVSFPTFTTDRGYTGNGSSSYVNTGYTPSVNGVNYTLSSASFGAWVVTVDATLFHAAVGVVGSGSGRGRIYWNTDWEGEINTSSGLTASTAATGLIAFVMSGTDKLYINGSVDNPGGNSPLTVPDQAFCVDASGQSGGATNFGAHQVAAAFMGGALSSTDMSNFYTRLRTYMTAVGVP